MRELRSAFQFVLSALGWVWWCAETTWVGGRAFVHASILVSRIPLMLAETRRCPRDHDVSMFSVFDCACGAKLEGWVFSACSVCRESAGYTPCPTCGLPVRNPLLP